MPALEIQSEVAYNRFVKYQNKISHLFLAGLDLGSREQEVLKDASEKLRFIPEKLMDRSSWWGSKEIGAFRYVGKFEGKAAVLKIQGVRTVTSGHGSRLFMMRFSATIGLSIIYPN